MQQLRPSLREVHKKIEEAKEALCNYQGIFANPAKAVGELYELGIGETSELWKLIKEILEEIAPQDYKGGSPPHKSYEKTIENHELFAYRWQSSLLNKEMYIKFALKNNRYYYVSLHESYSSERQETQP